MNAHQSQIGAKVPRKKHEAVLAISPGCTPHLTLFPLRLFGVRRGCLSVRVNFPAPQLSLAVSLKGLMPHRELFIACFARRQFTALSSSLKALIIVDFDHLAALLINILHVLKTWPNTAISFFNVSTQRSSRI